jgi:hypothetical protein
LKVPLGWKKKTGWGSGRGGQKRGWWNEAVGGRRERGVRLHAWEIALNMLVMWRRSRVHLGLCWRSQGIEMKCLVSDKAE